MVSPLTLSQLSLLMLIASRFATFDPIKRARQLADELPRQWQGTLRLAKSSGNAC